MFRILIVCLISLLIQFSATAPAEHSFILEVRATGDNWCPHQCPGIPNKAGYSIELVTESLKEMNVSFRFFYQNWTKATETVQKGYYDLLLSSTNPIALSLKQPQKPLLHQSLCSYQLQSSPPISRNLADLKDLRIAYLQGSHLGKELTEHLNDPKNNISVTQIDNQYQSLPSLLFQFLLNKSTDSIVLSRDLANFYFEVNHDVKNKVRLGYCTQPQPWYVGISTSDPKRSEELIRILDRGMKKLKANGRYEEIIKKYFPETDTH